MNAENTPEQLLKTAARALEEQCYNGIGRSTIYAILAKHLLDHLAARLELLELAEQTYKKLTIIGPNHIREPIFNSDQRFIDRLKAAITQATGASWESE